MHRSYSTHHAHGPAPLRRGGRVAVLGFLFFVFLLGLPAPGFAHGLLKRASPGNGDHLSTAPRELRLAFTEPVELAVARVELTGPSGPVGLAPLTLHPDSSTVLLAPIRGALVAGTYRVAWQVAGADGHPVRGRYTFVIAPGAEGLGDPVAGPAAPGGTPPPPEHHDATSIPIGPGFDAGSPLYAAIRWLTFLGLLGVIGAVAFRLVVLPLVRSRGEAAGLALIGPASERAARMGTALTAVLVMAVLLRLYAQSYALHGDRGALDPALIGTMLTRTVWGWGWLLQALGTSLAAAGLVLARRSGGVGWSMAALGALVLAFTPGLSGHAASAPVLTPLAVLADGLHVLGAGGWLGSLLFVLAAGIPAAVRLGGDRGVAVAALVNAFSPAALVFAGLVVATGVFASWIHLGSVPALWRTVYGQTLLVKLAVLSGVFATGAYNWLRVRPALGDDVGTRRLRRSATFELAVGVAVLAVTAVLVATATPERVPEAVVHVAPENERTGALRMR